MSEAYLKYAKFSVRALLSVSIMGIGAAIFFSSDDNTLKIIGSNMVTASWAAWMSSGSSSLPSSKNKTQTQNSSPANIEENLGNH